MPATCSVVNCTNRSNRENVRFFRFPQVYKWGIPKVLSEKRRGLWLDAINRDNWTESSLKNATVCSDHFLLGKYFD